MFEIVFETLTTRLMPHMLLKPKHKAWIDVLLLPLSMLYSSFLNFREEKLFETSINGQVMNLEYMLNYYFYNNGLLTTIYITDTATTEDRVILYNENEDQDETFLFNAAENEEKTYLLNSSEQTSATFDFIVNVPTSLVFDQNYMKSQINKFKLAGTTYRIELY